jgi:CDP-paratose 2-epimerase
MKKILITGGAGFVGSNLAILLKNDEGQNARIIALDNLKRRGSELNLPRLRQNGVEFVHGDIRNIDDLLEIGKIDLILECSAEPSVLAGYSGSPEYLIQTNLAGTVNCLEIARRHGADIVFLSTSRVYPIKAINEIKYEENETRFSISKNQQIKGASENGFSEDLSLDGTRSLYGATKLCSELLLQEYIEIYGIRGIINRCGVITGPWQMGKVGQGVVVLWVARHIFEKELSYIGYNGTGKQVRDILHVQDLYRLLKIEINQISKYNGKVYNVGGGIDVSVSLCELTDLCQKITGKSVRIKSVKENRAGDIPYYISDCSRVQKATGWKPGINCIRIVSDISEWINKNKSDLYPIIGK